MTFKPKSNHNDYIDKGYSDCKLIAPQGWPTKKYDVLNFKQYEYNKPNMDFVISKIQNCLSPNLLTQQLRKKYPNNSPRWDNGFFGYCVPATFVLLFLMDTNRLHPFSGHDVDGENHWWLQDMESGEILDVTPQQYTPKERVFVYSTGKPKRLYAFKGRPQKRMLDLIQLVQPNTTRYTVFSLNDVTENTMQITT